MRPFEPMTWDELPESAQNVLPQDAAPATKLMAARALLPMPTSGLASTLYMLSSDEDERVRRAARRSLTTLPNELLAPILADRISPKLLNWFANRDLPDAKLYEVIALNRATADETIEFLARERHEETLLTIVANNQERLLRAEGIVRALLQNDSLPLSASERVRNFVELTTGRSVEDLLREELPPEPETEPEVEPVPELEPAAPVEEALPTPEAGISEAEIEPVPFDEDEIPDLAEDFDPQLAEELERTINLDQLQRELFESDETFSMEFLVDPEEGLTSSQRSSLGHKIRQLSEVDKMRLGMKGSIEARQILMKSPNKMVQESVLRNPRITIEEIIKLSKDKTAREEIIRFVTANRDWTKNYQVIHNLCWNPKTPLTVAAKYLNRLNIRDLQSVAKSKQVPGMIAVQAKKMAVEKLKHR